MTPELFIASKASEAIKALYNADIEPSALQVRKLKKPSATHAWSPVQIWALC